MKNLSLFPLPFGLCLLSSDLFVSWARSTLFCLSSPEVSIKPRKLLRFRFICFGVENLHLILFNVNFWAVYVLLFENQRLIILRFINSCTTIWPSRLYNFGWLMLIYLNIFYFFGTWNSTLRLLCLLSNFTWKVKFRSPILFLLYWLLTLWTIFFLCLRLFHFNCKLYSILNSI